ncbi:MAG: phosphoribosylformylglycinamidine synthase [Candidatus Parcubacteria bacterium]|jgi:phosphoribosylformylglycinamidine synthase
MIFPIYKGLTPSFELGFYVHAPHGLHPKDLEKIFWLVRETFEPGLTSARSTLTGPVAEVGPRIQIETAFSSNAVAICESMGIEGVARIERTERYLIGSNTNRTIDWMTEELYTDGIQDFRVGIFPQRVQAIDLITKGKPELEKINAELGLGMDDKDIGYYHALFVETLKRNPTDVELVQLGNANSEHSRHWFFKGQIVIDGIPMRQTMFERVQQPLRALGKPNRSLVAFHDNAGVITGFDTHLILPATPGQASKMLIAPERVHITGTAETHNHPTFVAPFPGAQTGTGGRIRDTSAVGRGGIPGIGVAGYFTGNLFIPGYSIPGEEVGKDQPSTYASPLRILLEGSDGISSYGNEFGEPLTCGFTRTFGQAVSGEWREARKPVLYSGGVGHLFGAHVHKEHAEIGMLIVRIGGPAYPIGVGGGAASSMMQGQNTEALDFNSVQRGNAQMENRANRVIRVCVEMGNQNPIASIHDQGAGGPSNVLTELLEPLGGTIDIRKITLGDKSMSVLQIWSAEFQEGYGLLIRSEHLKRFEEICIRENCNCEVLGEIDGKGHVVVTDSKDGTTPVNLDLGQILTNMPQKTFHSERRSSNLPALNLPAVSIAQALEKVFRLPSVGSKGFLLHKVDRSVTGLVGQQQCCGIAQIPIANVSINAQSHFGLTGAATAVGEQPIKMLINPEAGARMAVAEMLTNMASALITSISAIRCRANWMWPAKLPHEGAALYDAAAAMSTLMIKLRIAADGGKDSLSMAATVSGKLVKAPGSLVVLGYAPVPDVTKSVTPDIKYPGSRLALIDLSGGQNRLGGSALAQAFNQLGNETPDVDDAELLKAAFFAIQHMLATGDILSLHDRSDGGLITAVAEMCMASRCGFNLTVEDAETALADLFTEELGFILEIHPDKEDLVFEVCTSFDVPISWIGHTSVEPSCTVRTRTDDLIMRSDITTLRCWWEATSTALEKLQTHGGCTESEAASHADTLLPGVTAPVAYHLTFTPRDTPPKFFEERLKPRVAILREEGTNGDREMAAAFLAAGMESWDVTMRDLMADTVTLDQFQGIVFAGGFSYMDVFGSAKGWAGKILLNNKLRDMFDQFYYREDTFSLGVCNGCQLMALLGWVPWKGIATEKQPRFIGNTSGRFESRWAQVEILPSPSILLEGMEGSKLGVWLAHGEGRLFYPDQAIADEIAKQQLAPLALLNPYGNRTEQYPYNPNGSPGGITALCSPNGRHLAMMPHPERCFRLWQWPFKPAAWDSLEASPWLQMFQNARTWCTEQWA